VSLHRLLTLAVVFCLTSCAIGAGNSAVAGTSPSRWMAAAERATILVATGPSDKPIRLGDMQPWSAGNTLHV
jgi:hypothetical protein